MLVCFNARRKKKRRMARITADSNVGIYEISDGITESVTAMINMMGVSLSAAANNLGRAVMVAAQGSTQSGRYRAGKHSMTAYILDPPPSQSVLTARTRAGVNAVHFWPPIVSEGVATVLIGFDPSVPGKHGKRPERPAKYMPINALRNPNWNILLIGIRKVQASAAGRNILKGAFDGLFGVA